MVALKLAGFRVACVVLATSVLAPGVVLAQAAAGAEQPGSDALARAEQAFLDADFETALTEGRRAVEQFAALGSPPPSDEDRARLARALDLVAESLYNLGQEKKARQALVPLVELEPGYRVDESIAGREFAKLLEAVRSERVGWIRLACRPLPCERVVADGRGLKPDSEGRIALPAGTRRVVLSRHDFRDEELPALEIEPGRTIDVTVELTQVARDVVLRTSPPGVDVSVDGTARGTTTDETGDGGGTSGPLSLTGLAPGPHVLVFEAPCRRRVEQRVEVVLEAADPSPLDLGVIELPPARGRVSIDWPAGEGTVLIDGAPVEPGTHELCPGVHELAVAIGASRVWVERLTLADGAERRFRPEPRPGIALAPSIASSLGAPARAGWNVLTLGPALEERLSAAVREVLGSRPPALAPRVERAGFDEKALPGTFPPDAVLAALVVEGVGPAARHSVAVLVDPRRGLIEAAAPAQGQGDAAGVLSRWLAGAWTPFGWYWGFDLAELDGGEVIVARVSPGSPADAAGLVAGRRVIGLAGGAVSGPGALDALRSARDDGTLAVTLAGTGGAEQSVEIAGARQLLAPDPWALAAPGEALLPLLARTSVLRLAGRGDSRPAAAAWSGLVLAALGRATEAIEALDRVEIPEALDPSADARATVGWTLWELLSKLSDPYADEVRARLGTLGDARAGGRGGPPIDLAGAPGNP